ncbi:hypothetical protein ACFWDI_04635 [Streptomyces sp. NPDC060064]|uniref:hypothetical protein n=1 Tax=Streptomyces sp. NPDC060064 TaxID=3347049 RepID=UPI0036AA4FA2
MFGGAHVLLHSRDADADGAFMKDAPGFAHVDAGRDRLVFQTPPAQMAELPPHEPRRPAAHRLSP